MIKAKTPTVCKPKFEANQIQRTKPIGKPTRKEFGSPTITDAALDRRRLLSSAALLPGVGAVLFPLVEAAAAESQATETHLAEVSLASGATLTVERSGQVALFGINRPQIQNRLDPTTFRALATAYYDYDPRSAAHTRCSTPTGDRARWQDRRLWSTRHQGVFGLRPPRCGPGGGGGAGPARGAVRRHLSHPRFSGGSSRPG